MLVFWNEKLVFLAVPKTGTTALEGALAPHAAVKIIDPPVLKHAPLYRYDRFLRPYFEGIGGEKLETLAVVREPIDWLASWYRYRGRSDLAGHRNSTANISFDEFVRGYLREKRPAYAEVGSQAKFLASANAGTVVDHLFRYEHQDRLLGFLEERLKIKITLRRKNESPARDVDLSPGIEKRLRRKMEAEFAVWEAAR